MRQWPVVAILAVAGLILGMVHSHEASFSLDTPDTSDEEEEEDPPPIITCYQGDSEKSSSVTHQDCPAGTLNCRTLQGTSRTTTYKIDSALRTLDRRGLIG